MKKWVYYVFPVFICLIAISGFVLYSCIKDHPNSQSKGDANDESFTVAEAKDYFEQLLSRESTQSSRQYLNPGEFTPKWAKATISSNERICCMDIPIISEYHYKAFGTEFNSKAYCIDIVQKLVVIQDKETNKMSCFIFSLIPDKAYAENNRNIENIYSSAGDKHEFSGLVIYTSPLSGKLQHIDTYLDGAKLWGLNIYDKKLTAEQKNIRLKYMLGGLQFQGRRAQNLMTRAFGEDDYSCFWCYDSGCCACDSSICPWCCGTGCYVCNASSGEYYNCHNCWDTGCEWCAEPIIDDGYECDWGVPVFVCRNCKTTYGCEPFESGYFKCVKCGTVLYNP